MTDTAFALARWRFAGLILADADVLARVLASLGAEGEDLTQWLMTARDRHPPASPEWAALWALALAAEAKNFQRAECPRRTAAT